MVALKTERRTFLWRITPRAIPQESKQSVTLEEVLGILESEFQAERARAYLGDGSRILPDGDPNADEKSQIYIADMQIDRKIKTATLLINRGDPQAVAQSYIDAKTKKVRIDQPKDTESPGWSAHLVISLKSEKAGYHKACFEKMPHVSSFLVLSLIDRIAARVAHKDGKYSYVVERREGKKVVKETRKYRPALDTKRVPSENLTRDLEQGELTSVVLTKKTKSYAGPGADKQIKKQEEKLILRTAPADAGQIKKLIKGVVKWGRDNQFEAISFRLSKLPGGATNNPTLRLDDHDALEQLYVRAMRLDGFTTLLEGCYGTICPHIQSKMIAVVNSKEEW